MNELEQNYKEKSTTLNGFKELFYKDKEEFKNFLHKQSLSQQIRLMAFFQVNDSEFYKEVENYTGGIKIV